MDRHIACWLTWFHSSSQDDTAFEKQSALFALAVSDIVLINMYVFCLAKVFHSLRTCFECFLPLSCSNRLKYFPRRWCHDIGREQAANKPLLKTVFQVIYMCLPLHNQHSRIEFLVYKMLVEYTYRSWCACSVLAKQRWCLSYVIKLGCVPFCISFRVAWEI